MQHKRLIFGLVGLLVVVGTSAGIAVSAVSASSVTSTEFLCANGERLLVAAQDGSVRVRTGSGVFNLQAADTQNHYQGQFLQVDLGADALELSRPELATPVSCKALRQRT